jgi:hypothetical protein
VTVLFRCVTGGRDIRKRIFYRGFMTNSTTGYDLNPIQRRAAIATPSKWHDMFVAGVLADGTIELRDLQTDAAIVLWHHAEFISAAHASTQFMQTVAHIRQ